jgi:hypothetical protein
MGMPSAKIVIAASVSGVGLVLLAWGMVNYRTAGASLFGGKHRRRTRWRNDPCELKDACEQRDSYARVRVVRVATQDSMINM